MKAVVFAYHNVGYRCLSVLLAHGVNVPLVVTHADSAAENIWFSSVAALAASHGIAVVTPEDPNDEVFVQQMAALQPDFLFSFYYRQMLKVPILELPRHGALNMHGSLLPKYRGRTPVNWAILKGERETGATLHYMVEKPDAGDIVAQQAVPILPNDCAKEVFDKVTLAAEMALDRVLPSLMEGKAPRQAQDSARGSYYGGRKPEDGRIDWSQSNVQVHNLVRAVAPPYPGAFTMAEGRKIHIYATRVVENVRGSAQAPALYCTDGSCYAQCQDGGVLRVLAMEVDGVRYGEEEFARMETVSPTYFDT
ncbi:MAG: formyltransferase [Burkholderiales bacterium]